MLLGKFSYSGAMLLKFIINSCEILNQSAFTNT